MLNKRSRQIVGKFCNKTANFSSFVSICSYKYIKTKRRQCNNKKLIFNLHKSLLLDHKITPT